ncbi:MAG: methyltransferase [bacterium]|nr:MAG: methyltransferase [bacterium]
MAAYTYSGIENLEIMEEARNYNKFLIDMVQSDISKGDRILDFGAGTGTFAIPLTSLGYNVICVEPDPNLSARLNSLSVSAVNDIDDIPDNSIDGIYALNVLEHIKDDAFAVNRWYDKLKPGGRLMVYVPAFKILFTSMDYKVEHLRRYRRKDLTKIIRDTGFQVTDAAYIDSLGFFITLFFRLIDNGKGIISKKKMRIYDRFLFPISNRINFITRSFFGKNLMIKAIRP